MSEKTRIVPLLLLVLLASGCVRARAKTLPTGPPLDVPPPPPRVLQPVETQAEAPPPPETVPVPDEPRRPSTSARPRPAAPVEPPKTAEEPPKGPPVTAPVTPPAATTLQITPAAEQGEVERAIRVT